jgi:hypothetical protein
MLCSEGLGRVPKLNVVGSIPIARSSFLAHPNLLLCSSLPEAAEEVAG